MANDLNVVALVGRLTRSAEIKYSLNGGTPLIRFSIAVNRRRKGADGNYADEANFFDCVYFTQSADRIISHLEKGKQVAITGELRQNRWEQDGQPRSKVEISVNNLTLISSGNSQSGSSGSHADSGTVQESVNGPEVFKDDDIPF